jgi:hypothetical protein
MSPDDVLGIVGIARDRSVQPQTARNGSRMRSAALLARACRIE